MRRKRQWKPKGWVNQTDLFEMGFTKTMIDNLLLRPNKIFCSDSHMKIWRKSTVANVMKTDEYKRALEKAQKRKKASEKAVATKKDKLESEISRAIRTLRVAKIPVEHLVRYTLLEKEDWYAEVGSEHGNVPLHKEDVDNITLQRWVVNYIRHNLVSYDSTLNKMDGKVGKFEVYPKFKKAVLAKIAETYPTYAEECNRQIAILQDKAKKLRKHREQRNRF